MKINYYVAFKTGTGANAWSDDLNFKRGVYAEQPLDETLDTGIVVDVPASLRKIAPFTLCRITAKEVLSNDEEADTPLYTKYYWTADRETEAVTLFGVGNEIGNLAGQKYKQTIKLIELTKILEREPCDSLSFMHRMQANYAPYSTYANYTTSAYYTEPNSDTPRGTLDADASFTYHKNELNNFYLTPAPSAVFGVQFIPIYATNYSYTQRSTTTLKITAPNGDVLFNDTIYAQSGSTGGYYPNDPDFDSDFGGKTYTDSNHITLVDFSRTEVGYYTFLYKYRCDISQSIDYVLEISFDIYIDAIEAAKPIPSITDVINRILSVGTPRPTYKAPKYRLDQAIKEKFSEAPAPEFFFPRMTMFEALLEVGKKIHGIPRIMDNSATGMDKITYDLLGLDEEYSIPSGATIVGYKNIQASDDYCGAIDSYAENHINTVDPNAGTITEPYDGGYKTLRCESGVQITNQSAVFECSRPIYRIVKVEMAYTKGAGQTEPIGDITKYVYEQAEYAGLYVSDQVRFPYSVSHALVWKQGDRFIRGFNTTSSSLLNIIQQFKKPSIQNIVTEDELKDFPADTLYGNLAFRVTYIPMDNIRLRQYKPYETHPDGNLLYNQQNANTVEASYYGEALKGKIARMGNEVEVYTIRYTSSEQELPKIGNLLVDENDDVKGYVYKVTTRGERNFIMADVYVTPDFNRLSEYFSLESNFRLFEVSERQSIDRQVMVPRIIDVSLNELATNEEQAYAMATEKMVSRFMGTFVQTEPTGQSARPTVAVCKTVGTFDNDTGTYPQIGRTCYALPVNSTACGNSLAFSFAFDDSYSAGHRSTNGDGSTVDNGTGSGSNVQWKQQKNSPYGDIYGSFYALEFAIADSLYSGASTKKTPTWADQSTAGGFCDSLPTVENSYFNYTEANAYMVAASYGTEGSNARVIDKNSSEHISVTVQFHGRAKDKKIVFGPAMWNNNLLIRDEPVKELDADGNPTTTNREPPHIYALMNKRLNMLRSTLDNIPQYNGNNIVMGDGIIDFGRFNASYLEIGSYYGAIKRMWLEASYNIKSWCIADPTNGEIYIGVNEPLAAGGAFTSPIYFNFDREA